MRRQWMGDLIALVAALSVIGGAAALMRARQADAAPPGASPPARFVAGATRYARGGRIIGSAEARVSIIEFSDFECPFCRQLHEAWRVLDERHPGLFNVRLRHYPLAGHVRAVDAAVAAECAGRQGRFGEFSKLLFEGQNDLRTVSWDSVAQVAGVANRQSFAECRSLVSTKSIIDVDIADGADLNIAGTPAFLIGDTLYTGVLPVDSLENEKKSAFWRQLMLSCAVSAAGAVAGLGVSPRMAQAATSAELTGWSCETTDLCHAGTAMCCLDPGAAGNTHCTTATPSNGSCLQPQ